MPHLCPPPCTAHRKKVSILTLCVRLFLPDPVRLSRSPFAEGTVPISGGYNGRVPATVGLGYLSTVDYKVSCKDSVGRTALHIIGYTLCNRLNTRRPVSETLFCLKRCTFFKRLGKGASDVLSLKRLLRTWLMHTVTLGKLRTLPSARAHLWRNEGF